MDKSVLKALIYAKGKELGFDESMIDQMIATRPSSQIQATSSPVASSADPVAQRQIAQEQRQQEQRQQEADQLLQSVLGGYMTPEQAASKNSFVGPKLKENKVSPTSQTSKVDPDVKKQQNKLKTLNSSLKVLEENYNQVEAKGRGAGDLGLLLGGLTGGAMYGETADYEALRKGLIGPVARAISGEVGVLTDRDIARAENLLPKVTDDPALAERKFRNITNLIKEQGGQTDRKNKDIKSNTSNTGNPLTDAIKNNPVLNFLVGGAVNVAQDVGTGIRAGQEQPQLNQQEQQAKQLEDKAYATKDMQQRSLLLKEANKIRRGTSTEATNISQSFSPDVQDNPINRAVGAATQIATTAEIPAAVGGIKKGLDTILHPFKAVGNIRAAEIEKVAEKTIDGDKLIQGLEKVRSKVPSTERAFFEKAVEGAKQAYGGQKIKIGDAVELNKYLNDAFTASGTVGKSAKALVEKSLGDIVKREIKDIAPGVTKANKLFEILYGSKKLGKSLVKPVAAGATTAYLLNKLGVNR